jgi:hypothetical protein
MSPDAVEGVQKKKSAEHFWEHSPGIFVGTVSVRVRQVLALYLLY